MIDNLTQIGRLSEQFVVIDGIVSIDPELIGGGEGGSTVKVSATDNTAGYLDAKLIAGAGIEFARNESENETLTISAPIAVYSDAEDVATLPASPVFGQIFEYIGNGTAWEINANENQQIRILNSTGNKLFTTNAYACVMLVYLDDDDRTWLVKSSIGDISLGSD